MNYLNKLYELSIHAASLATFSNLKKAYCLVRRGRLLQLYISAYPRLTSALNACRQRSMGSDFEAFNTVEINDRSPIISVIIPCFNYGTYIIEAIDSVLAQTIKDIEIIVVDGGSTDEYTRDTLLSLSRPRTLVFLRKERHFVGSNRNFGISKANGRYICCLDADDTLSPTYIEKAVYLMETHGYDIVSTSVKFVGTKTGVFDILQYPDFTALQSANHISTCGVFRRDLWQKVGGYRDTGIGIDHIPEDWDLWLRISATGARIRNITKEALFNYRTHEQGSLSSTNVRPLLKLRECILDQNKALLCKYNTRLSKRQRARKLLNLKPGGALASSYQNQLPSHKCCIFIAIPYCIAGGAERLLSQYSSYLSDIGWQVVFISSLPQPADTVSAKDWFQASTSEFYCLPDFLETKEWDYFVNYLLESRKPRYLLLAGSQYFYERLRDLRQNFANLIIVDLLFNTVGHVSSHLMVKHLINSALCENEEVRQYLLDNGWEDSRITLLESSVDTQHLQPRPKDNQLLESLGISSNKILVGFSGRLSEEKGPDIFLQIASLCHANSNIEFIMTGCGYMHSEILGRRDKMLINNLHYLGFVNNIEDVVSQYDILVLPSRIDGRPQIVLEALSMGIAVIASDVGGLSKLIRHGSNGYLCSVNDTRSFSDYILMLAGNPDLLSRTKRYARQYAIEYFNSMLSGAQLVNALEGAFWEATTK